LTLTNLQPGPYAITATGTAGGTATNSAEVDFLVVTNYPSVTGTPPGRNFNKLGNILIADQFNNRVVEITPNGQIVWSFGLGPEDFSANSIIGVNDAQRVGTWTLMAGTGTPSGIDPNATNGRPIWQYGQFGQSGFGANQLNSPVQCTYLPTSHILITDQGNDRIIEVTLDKNIVWSYPGNNTNASDQLNSPNSAELLTNGNILIADEGHNRAIEVTREDVIARTFTASGTAGGIEFAIRLRNGDTLISDQFNNRVIRVNHARHIVASYGLRLDGGGVIGNNTGFNTNSVDKGMFAPYDAKVINDFTGLTPPVDNTADSLNQADPPPSSSGSEW
jgi:hypothetical protein